MQSHSVKSKTHKTIPTESGYLSFKFFALCFGVDSGGYAALTMTLLVLFASLGIIGGLTFFSLQEARTSRLFVKSVKSRSIAEAGMEDALYRVLGGKQIGTSETLSAGGGAAAISVSSAGGRRTIRSAAGVENIQQNIEAVVESVTTGLNFFYGAQVGDGGLEMEQNSSVKGSVYSNGHIIGDNGAAITGDALAAGTSRIEDVAVGGNAHANLIDDSTVGGYASSTTKLDDVVVGGDAHADELEDTTVTRDAYYRIIDGESTVLGARFPGTPPPANLLPLAMPISDAMINTWKNEASALGKIAGGTCSQEWSPPTDPYTLNGGVLERSLKLDNNATLILKGTVWVKCNVTIDNGSRITLDPTYGDMSGVLVADGWMHFKNNGAFQGSGTPGSYLMLLSTATGGGHHGSAIDLHNNAVGAIFYAANGLVYLHNGVKVTEITAKKVHLENNAELIYETGLKDVKFSAGPTGGYDVRYWREVE